MAKIIIFVYTVMLFIFLFVVVADVTGNNFCIFLNFPVVYLIQNNSPFLPFFFVIYYSTWETKLRGRF
jgi:hypothetical protein